MRFFAIVALTLFELSACGEVSEVQKLESEMTLIVDQFVLESEALALDGSDDDARLFNMRTRRAEFAMIAPIEECEDFHKLGLSEMDEVLRKWEAVLRLAQVSAEINAEISSWAGSGNSAGTTRSNPYTWQSRHSNVLRQLRCAPPA